MSVIIRVEPDYDSLVGRHAVTAWVDGKIVASRVCLTLWGVRRWSKKVRRMYDEVLAP